MKHLLLIALITINLSCKNEVNNATSKIDSIQESENLKVDPTPLITSILNGVWVNTQDSLATVEIKNEQWLFKYDGDSIDISDPHKYVITEPIFDKENNIIDGGLILIQNSDTLEYTIDFLSKTNMELMYLPQGNYHHYLKKEK